VAERVVPPPGEPDDPLAELRERVRDAQRAAERLAAEAAEGGAAVAGEYGEQTGSTRTPPSGWASENEEGGAGGWAGADSTTHEIRALVDLVDSLRRLLPEDLRAQLADLVRQLLLVLRAIIDWLVSRIERGPPGTAHEVEDIPIS
jgi:hypothetical protein